MMDNNVQRQGDDLWKVTSSTEDGKVYSVIRWADKDLMCDCMGFRRYKNCKHIGAVQKMIDIARRNG